MSNEQTVKSLVSQFNFATMRAKEIAESLLTRAVEQGREEKMMERISFHFKRAHDMPEGHKKLLELAKDWDGMARSVRALNVRALHEGVAIVFSDEGALKNKAIIAPPSHRLH